MSRTELLMTELNIQIKGIAMAEQVPLATALARVAREAKDLAGVEIFCQSRLIDGFLEYGIMYTFKTGGRMYVAMIQRKQGAEYEFHS